MKKIKPFLPTIISLLVLVIVAIWFVNTYTEKTVKLSPIFNSEKFASISIDTPDNVLLNRSFNAVVTMNTRGNAVNAIGFYLLYPIDSLRVVNIDTTKSFCQFYPEKKINDTLGLISLSCGSPNPGFTGENSIIEIEFQPLQIGSVSLITKDNSKILLSDGKGTNILNEFPVKKLIIQNSL